MIAAFAKAGAVLDRPDYTAAAVRAADFILTQDAARRTAGCTAPRPSVRGPKIDAYLEDYAFLIDALVDLYEATFDVRWLEAAEELAGIMVDRFADPAGGFFTTPAGQSDLIMRLKDQHDGSTPSGSAMAITGLLRLAELTGTTRWREEADRGLRAMRGVMHDSPMAAAQMLIALDFALGPMEEVAIVGEPRRGHGGCCGRLGSRSGRGG